MPYKTSGSSLATILSRQVHEGKEDEFRSWVKKIEATLAQQVGFISSENFEPMDPSKEFWVTIINFDTEENLNSWKSSSEKKTLIEEVRKISSQVRVTTNWGSFEGLFPSDSESSGDNEPVESIPAWKMMFAIVCALYPVIFFLSHYFGPIMAQYITSFPFKLLVMNGLAVSCVTWLSMPIVKKKILKSWLVVPSASTTQKDATVAALIIIVLVALAFVFQAGFTNFS